MTGHFTSYMPDTNQFYIHHLQCVRSQINIYKREIKSSLKTQTLRGNDATSFYSSPSNVHSSIFCSLCQTLLSVHLHCFLWVLKGPLTSAVQTHCNSLHQRTDHFNIEHNINVTLYAVYSLIRWHLGGKLHSLWWEEQRGGSDENPQQQRWRQQEKSAPRRSEAQEESRGQHATVLPLSIPADHRKGKG